MSILTQIFSSGATELIKGIGGVVDNLHTSKDEKLAAELKIKELVASYEVQMEKEISVVEAKWTDLLQLVLITVIGAYFGGRSLEKAKK